jgi:hypothetical protein
MLMRLVMRAGAIVRLHSYENEQITNLLQGVVEFSNQDQDCGARRETMIFLRTYPQRGRSRRPCQSGHFSSAARRPASWRGRPPPPVDTIGMAAAAAEFSRFEEGLATDTRCI